MEIILIYMHRNDSSSSLLRRRRLCRHHFTVPSHLLSCVLILITQRHCMHCITHTCARCTHSPNQILWSKCFHYVIIAHDVRPLTQLNARRNGHKDLIYGLSNRFRLPREVYNQRFPPETGCLSGEHCCGHVSKTDGAHLFTIPWNHAVTHRFGGFRGDVTRGGPCASCGYHQATAFFIT